MPTPFDHDPQRKPDETDVSEVDLGTGPAAKHDAPAGTVTPPPPAGGPVPYRDPYQSGVGADSGGYPNPYRSSAAQPFPPPPGSGLYRPPSAPYDSQPGISVGGPYSAPPPAVSAPGVYPNPYASGPRSAPPEAPLEVENLATGAIIDEKYQILVKLGQGGMGAVYRARHKLLEKDVALKIIAPHMAQDRNFRARFFREAKVAMEFIQRHAIPVRDFGVTKDGLYYMTMDFSTGRSLRDLVEKEGALPPERATRVVLMILEALAEAHRKKIIHRDLKPDNVMVEEQDGKDFVKVLDFGLAKIATVEGEGPSLVSGEAILGTPAYMSPEQACGEEVDHRADIYASGVVLYQLLTGKLPFNAPTSRQMILKHVSAVPPPLRETKPDLAIPDGLEAVVMKALAKEKLDRFQNAEEFHEALEPFSGGTPRKATQQRPIVQLGGGALSAAPTVGGAAPGEASLAGEATEAFADGTLTGMTIDRYKILAPIAEGGMGAVYRAEHLLMCRECAFKVIKGAHAQDPEVLSRFQREAQVSAKFKHPSAVEVYDFGKMGGKAHFMAMELVNGKPLSDRLSREGALPLKDTVEIICQTLEVLEAAHKAGIVHRDLKPDNIMLQAVDDWQNQVKLLDFGIAKMADTRGEAAKFHTMAGAFFGTPQYSSPEQCKGESVDSRSDLYSMGTILYEMLTGKLPFESETAGGYLVQHMVSPPKKLRDAKPDVDAPAEVEAVVQKALSKRRDDRYATAGEFSEALKQASGIHPYFEVGDHGVRLGTGPEVVIGTSKKMALAIAFVVALVAGVVVFFLARGDMRHAGIQLAITPAGEASITLTSKASPPHASASSSYKTNAQGALTLAKLAPGEWTLVVTREGFESDERQLKLDGGRTVELPIVLELSKEGLRREAAAARDKAVTAHADARDANAAALAGPVLAEGEKEFGEAEKAVQAKRYDVAKERFETAEILYQKAKENAAKTAEEIAAVEQLVKDVDKARDAAEKALAKAYAPRILEKAAEDERAGRGLAKTDERQQARVRLASARAMYERAAEEARDELDRKLSLAKFDFERALKAAEDVFVRKYAKDLFDQADDADTEAAAKEKGGDKRGALEAWTRATDIIKQAREVAAEKKAATEFAARVSALLEEGSNEKARAKTSREAAERASAAKLAEAAFLEAERKYDLAKKREEDAKLAMRDGAEKVEPEDRTEIEVALKIVIDLRREATLAFKEAESLAERQGERQRLLRSLATQRQEAASQKAAYERALVDAQARSADVAEAKKKAIDAASAAAQADAAAKAAEAPAATPNDIQNATDAAASAARAWQEAAVLAQAAAARATDSGPGPTGPKAAAERLAASYKKAVETKDLNLLRKCFLDFSSMETGWKRMFANDGLSMKIDILSVTVTSDDEAEVVISNTSTENGRAGTPRKGRLTLGRAGGAWKITEVGNIR